MRLAITIYLHDTITYAKVHINMLRNHCLSLYMYVSQRTPLHIATENGYKYTVESLVKNEADISISDHDGVSM